MLTFLFIAALIVSLVSAVYFAHAAWKTYQQYASIRARFTELCRKAEAKEADLATMATELVDLFAEAVPPMVQCVAALILIAVMQLGAAINVSAVWFLASQ